MSSFCYQSFTNKMSAEKVIAQTEDCPICMDIIEGLSNRVVTDCGHVFHCSCLMQNAVHNGFGCPYCRTKMAEEPEEEDDEEDDEDDISIESSTIFEEDALTSFRMFHQRINGDEVEEEPAEEWETDDDDDDEQDDEQYEANTIPDSTYMTQKLAEHGITMEDLVKDLLFQEYGNYFRNYERRSYQVYSKFKAIVSQYTPQEPTPTPTEPCVSVPIVSETHSFAPPAIAESKSVAVHRRKEFMNHV